MTPLYFFKLSSSDIQNSYSFVLCDCLECSLCHFRYFSKLYIHGHSVGGTNPALLEAMTAKSFILCHDNKFNKSVIANGALYFDSIDSLKLIFNNSDIYHQKEKFVKENLESIEENYRWNIVVDKYENYFKRILNNK